MLKPPKDLLPLLERSTESLIESHHTCIIAELKDVSTQTATCELLKVREKVVELEKEVHDQDIKLNQQLFCLSSVRNDDAKIAFFKQGSILFLVLRPFLIFLNQQQVI